MLSAAADVFATERRGGTAKPLFELPESVSKLYLLAMRQHARKASLTYRLADDWVEIPDWRLDRRVLRIGLFLQHRLQLAPRERVLLFAPVSPECVLADLAVIIQG